MFSRAANEASAEGTNLPTLFVAPMSAVPKEPGTRCPPALGEGLAEMLVTDLAQLGKFELLESAALQDLRDEINLGDEGEVATDEKATPGQWAAADFMFRAKVIGFGNTEKTLTKVGPVVLPIKLGRNLAHVQIDWRLVDVARRKIVATGHAQGEAKGASWSFDGGLDSSFFQTQKFRESGLGRATTNALAAIIADLAKLTLPPSGRRQALQAKALKDAPAGPTPDRGPLPVSGQVLGTASGGVVVVSLGGKQGLKNGDRVQVFELVDTKDDDGKVIFTEEKPVGEVVLEAVNEDRSKGRYAGAASPKVGWIAKRR